LARHPVIDHHEPREVSGMNPHTSRRLAILLLPVAGLLLMGSEMYDDRRARVRQWSESLAIDPRVVGEVRKYVRDNREFSEKYAMELAAGVRALIFEAADACLRDVSNGHYEPFVQVDFPDPGFAVGRDEDQVDKLGRRFEKGFVRSEFLAFIKADGVTPTAAMSVYTSKDFRLKTSSRTRRIWDEEDVRCVEARKKTFVPPMMSCNRVEELHGEGFALQHSQVVSNPGGTGFQTIYYKESLKTFIEVPGGILVHYINYSRSKKVNSFTKGIARKKLVTAQQEAVKVFEETLAEMRAQ
jgi:hypothetical protein